jgi:hypothetical protein
MNRLIQIPINFSNNTAIVLVSISTEAESGSGIVKRIMPFTRTQRQIDWLLRSKQVALCRSPSGSQHGLYALYHCRASQYFLSKCNTATIIPSTATTTPTNKAARGCRAAPESDSPFPPGGSPISRRRGRDIIIDDDADRAAKSSSSMRKIPIQVRRRTIAFIVTSVPGGTVRLFPPGTLAGLLAFGDVLAALVGQHIETPPTMTEIGQVGTSLARSDQRCGIEIGAANECQAHLYK